LRPVLPEPIPISSKACHWVFGTHSGDMTNLITTETQSVALAEYLDNLSTFNADVDEESVQLSEKVPTTHHNRRWRTLVASTLAALALMGVGSTWPVALIWVIHGPVWATQQTRTLAMTSAVEDLFTTKGMVSDAHGVLWQAPHRGVATADCRFAHAYTCGVLCCCDEDHYWNGPNMMTGQEQQCTSKEHVPADVISALDGQME